MDLGMKPFFILGLPRSRTLWFSKLFEGMYIHCAHEHFSIHEEREIIYGVRGYADTNPLMAPDYGDAPVLIIERNIDDVISSIYNAFDKPDGINDWGQCIRNYIVEYKKALDDIEPENCLRVNYLDINTRLVEIWNFLVPDTPHDSDYLSKITSKVIKTDNRNIQGSLEHTFGSIENFAKKYDRSFLTAVRITDYMVARYIINACWDEISEDGIEQYMPDIVNEYWIGLYDEDELVGCYRLHQVNKVTLEGHAFMLPECRKKHSVNGCLTTLNWIVENTDCQKLIASVPKLYPNVMGFLEKIGFKLEGINRQSFMKKGQLWDMVQYGLTISEIKRLL